MVLFAKEAVRAKGKLVTRHELFVTSHAAKALQVENLVLGSHDEIASTKGAGALLALGAKQPAMVKVTLYKCKKFHLLHKKINLARVE